MHFIESGFSFSSSPRCSPLRYNHVWLCRPLYPWAAWVIGGPVLVKWAGLLHREVVYYLQCGLATLSASSLNTNLTLQSVMLPNWSTLICLHLTGLLLLIWHGRLPFHFLSQPFLGGPELSTFFSSCSWRQARRMVECTSVTQLHCVRIMFLYVITHSDYKLPAGRALWFSSYYPHCPVWWQIIAEPQKIFVEWISFI